MECWAAPLRQAIRHAHWSFHQSTDHAFPHLSAHLVSKDQNVGQKIMKIMKATFYKAMAIRNWFKDIFIYFAISLLQKKEKILRMFCFARSGQLMTLKSSSGWWFRRTLNCSCRPWSFFSRGYFSLTVSLNKKASACSKIYWWSTLQSIYILQAHIFS